MNFIKKHYEKIILAIFLLIFILSLVWTIIILNKSLDVTTDDLKLGKIPADYKVAKMNEYEISANFKEDKLWAPTNVVDTEDKAKSYTDLLVPYPARRCDKCLKIIPLSAFFEEKCPLCQKKLEKPTEIKINTELDKDKDGIPNVDEQELGLNPGNPEDVYLDMDEDGFNNLCEFKEKTDLKDPASFPGPTIKLFVKSISRKNLPFKLERVVQRGGEENKNKWEIQAKIGKTENNMKLKFFRLGDVIDLNGDKYAIVDIISKTENKIDSKRVASTEDASEVVIKMEADEPITVSPGTIAKESKDKIIFVDFVTKDRYVTSKGESFEVKLKGKPIAKFIVKDVNYKDKIVTLKDEKEGKEYEVGPKSIFEEKKYMKPEDTDSFETVPKTEVPSEKPPVARPGTMPPEEMMPPGMMPPGAGTDREPPQMVPPKKQTPRK